MSNTARFWHSPPEKAWNPGQNLEQWRKRGGLRYLWDPRYPDSAFTAHVVTDDEPTEGAARQVLEVSGKEHILMSLFLFIFISLCCQNDRTRIAALCINPVRRLDGQTSRSTTSPTPWLPCGPTPPRPWSPASSCWKDSHRNVWQNIEFLMCKFGFCEDGSCPILQKSRFLLKIKIFAEL